MTRFGYTLDGETGTYFDAATLTNIPEIEWGQIEYPNIDFFISRKKTKRYFCEDTNCGRGHFYMCAIPVLR